MAEEADQAPATNELTEEDAREQREMAGIPAIYVDTWHLYTWTGHMRITFGEIFGDIDSFRSAVVMEIDDAERLANQILRMIERRRARRRQREEDKTES